MKKKCTTLRGLLLDVYHRAAGGMTGNDGKPVEWQAADQVVLLAMYQTAGSLTKYTIAPEKVQQIYDATKEITWGTVVDIQLADRQVVGITVVASFDGDGMATARK